jgi:hypothetical protein
MQLRLRFSLANESFGRCHQHRPQGGVAPSVQLPARWVLGCVSKFPSAYPIHGTEPCGPLSSCLNSWKGLPRFSIKRGIGIKPFGLAPYQISISRYQERRVAHEPQGSNLSMKCWTRIGQQQILMLALAGLHLQRRLKPRTLLQRGSQIALNNEIRGLRLIRYAKRGKTKQPMHGTHGTPTGVCITSRDEFNLKS